MGSRTSRTSVIAYLVAIAVLLTSAKALAVPASPDVHILTQPDGTSFEAVQWGDEWLHGLETSEGYTIVLSESTGFWEYARVSLSGELEPSGMRVGVQVLSDSMRLHVRPSREVMLQRRSCEPEVSAKVVPSIGTANLPVILIEFSDRSHTYSTAQFEDLLFGDHPAIATGPGSMKDYYNEVSYGAFSVSPGPAGVVGWFAATRVHDYYGDTHGKVRAAELVKEAVLAADPYVDFSKYDNDHDGIVDTVMIVHQGRGAEESRDSTDIWSHKWSLSGAGVGAVYADGVWINTYTIQPEKYRQSISSIGIFAHEYGHALGLPDLYDIDDSSEGVGNWCLMGGGNWNRTNTSGDSPAHMSAWCKSFLGWVSPTLVRGSYARRKFDATAYAGDVVQLLPNPNGPSDWDRWGDGVGEYFLVENRYKAGFDAGLPGSGLAIWHIDERQGNNADEYHKLVDLEEADGRDDLDWKRNRGDAGDLYPGSSNNRRFGDLTIPDNWWHDYRNTGCSIRNISDAGPVMTADVSLNCACTGPSYDDIGRFLWSLDEDYFDLRRDYSRLADSEFLGLFGGVFINCTDDLTVTPAMASALRTFVGNGGMLMATDWAYPVIQQAFPGYVTFLGDDPRIGVAGQITSLDARDPSLARYMGDGATTIELDLGYWAVMDKVSEHVEVGLTGDVRVDTTNPPRFGSASGAPHTSLSEELEAGAAVPKGVEILRGKPLTVAFQYGSGSVMYSSPHMHAQGYTAAPQADPGRMPIGDTSLERLALWNTLATITGSEALVAGKAVENRGCSPFDKVIDSVEPNDCLEYEIDHTTGGALAISAATSRGTVEMTAYDAEGRLAASAEVGHAPVTMFVADAVRGKWILQVRASGDDASSIAFVVCIGEGAQSGPELAEGEVRFGPNPANAALNVYYSLSADADLMVYDVAGRMVYSCRLPASEHQLVWDLTTKSGAPLANGLYLVVTHSEGKAMGKPFRLVVQR